MKNQILAYQWPAAILALGITVSLPSVANAADTTAGIVVRNDKQTGLPPPQLGISPSSINVNLDTKLGKSDTSLTIYNYNTAPKTIRLNLIDLDANLKPVASSDATLKNWTLINPTLFTIPGSGYQTVRISVRPPQGFAKATYHSVLLIEQQIDNPVQYDGKNKVVKLEIGSRYGLPMTVNVK